MIYFSQNDPRWKNDRLGFGTDNTTTIGSHGCTITAIGMLAGIAPARVNELFTYNDVFTNSRDTPRISNLVHWLKIHQGIPSLSFVWRGYQYENDRVSDAIKKNGGCLVAVDGSRIGGGKKDGHWVLYIGNKKMVDPFDGLVKSTNYYPATGYAILDVIADTNQNSNGGSMADSLTAKLMKRYSKGSEADLEQFFLDHLGVDGQGGSLKDERLRVLRVKELLGIPEKANDDLLFSTLKGLLNLPLPTNPDSGTYHDTLPKFEGYIVDGLILRRE